MRGPTPDLKVQIVWKLGIRAGRCAEVLQCGVQPYVGKSDVRVQLHLGELD